MKKDLTFPDDRLYSDKHIWLKKDGENHLAGISDFAQDQLDEIVYADLPFSGQTLDRGEEFGTVESVKTVNSLYMPIKGKVLEINEAVTDSPESLNTDCYNAWLVRIQADKENDFSELMNAEAYKASLSK